MAHDLLWLRVCVIASVPAGAPEVGTWNPCLVDVNDVVALAVDLQHFLREKRTENLVSLGVTL